MKQLHRRAFHVAAILALVLCGGLEVQSAELPEAVKKLIPLAQKEGAATVFGTTMNPRQVAEINKSFNDLYGTDIKLNQTGGRHTRKRVEVIRALKNNVPTGLDIFWTTSPRALIKANALIKFDWAGEFGLPKDLMEGEYGIKTHDSYLTLVTVNTNLVKPSEQPTSYKDLLDKKWKGKIAMTRSPSPWTYFSYAFGEKEAVKYFQALVKQQNSKLLPGYPDVRARVIGGEFAVGIGTDAWAEMRKGAPVVHPPMDMVILAPRGAYIVKDSKAPNIAKLWGYWAVSAPGQKTLHHVRGYSLASTKGTDINAYLQGKKVIHIPFEWRMKNDERLSKKFSQLMRDR